MSKVEFFRVWKKEVTPISNRKEDHQGISMGKKIGTFVSEKGEKVGKRCGSGLR